MDTTGHVSTTEEENRSEEMGVCVENQTLPARSVRRSESIKPTNIESLPDDVVFDILARVPAHDIHHAARLISRKWYQTTRTNNFLRAQLQQSTCGLLIQPYCGSGLSNKKLILFATHKGQRIIEISKFYYKFTCYVLSSCNGLMLERFCEKRKTEYRITNLVTKQHLNLPSIGTDMGSYSFLGMGMAYAVASNKYKVVRSFYNSKSGEEECAILTVGEDEDWERRVVIQHLSPTAKGLFKHFPLTTDGFVHWAAQHGSGCCPEYVFTLNVETEVITQFPAFPASILCGCDGKTKLLYRCLPMGSCLSLLIARDSEFPIWDQIWVMKPETGEWTKMMSIDSESQKRAFERVSPPLNCKFRPVGWLKFREVLVFYDVNWWSGTEICIAYNVLTHEIESYKLDFSPYTYIVHRNSLAWLDGC